MEIRCESCRKKFSATPNQVKQFERARVAGKSILLMTCGICHLGTIVRPTKPIPDSKSEELLLRCPVATCTGFIVPIQKKKKTLYSCGECGSVWGKLESVYKEISTMVEHHSYRRKCYRNAKDEWHPVPPEKEPADYGELVEGEVPEKRKSLKRD